MSTQHLTDTEFIIVWNDAPNRTQAAKRARMSNRRANHRASRLRDQGHDLKQFRDAPPIETFYKVWNASPSSAAAAAKLGCSPEAARQRARILRRKGYELKQFGVVRKQPKAVKRRVAPREPISFAPGTWERIEAFRMRYERGEHLSHPLDATTETAINRTPAHIGDNLERIKAARRAEMAAERGVCV